MSKSVLIILICLSIKPIDLGLCEEDVIWLIYCDARNFGRVSDENGGQLSVKILLGRPYWEIKICSFQMMDSADLDDFFCTKGYLLKVSEMKKYSLLL